MPQNSFLEDWSCEDNQNTVIFSKETLNGIRAGGLDWEQRVILLWALLK